MYTVIFPEIGSGDLTTHARSQTSFEFRKGKAFPVLSGIVVAAENEDTILEASALYPGLSRIACSPAR